MRGLPCALALVALVACGIADAAGHPCDIAPAVAPMVIAHRGASGYRPEHTLAAYDLAILQGADYIEPDLVMTRDGVLVARHENALAVVDDDGAVREATTDVHTLPQFAARRTTKVVDGTRITGWFVEDFTAAELKTLRARERIPRLRSGNAAYDDRFGIPTLQEIVDLARQRSRELGRTIGVYPELKHPGYFEGIGLPMEDALLATLHASYGNTATAPVFIQSFEVRVLERLRPRTQLPLVQLIAPDGRPHDFTVSGDRRTYADLATPTGLAGIATYANGVGVHKSLIIPRRPDGTLGTPTRLVQDAHAVGLVVHAWTFRAENHFLPVEYRRGADPAAAGDAEGELCAHLRAGIDGFFSDHPDRGVAIIGCRCSHETRVLD